MINITPAQLEAFGFEWAYHLLPDGRGVHFSFNEATHTYRVRDPFDGHCFNVPSVTTVLASAGLRPECREIPLPVLESGSLVQKAAHLANLKALDYATLDPQVAPYFSGYEKFLKDSGFKVVYTERRVVGCWNELWWGGTIDVEGGWEGSPWILDLKCAAEDHESFKLQTAGCLLTLPKPRTPPFCYRRATLRLRPDGTYAPPRAYTDPQDAETFLIALRLEWEKRRRKIR
jgi:hypothetical protein